MTGLTTALQNFLSRLQIAESEMHKMFFNKSPPYLTWWFLPLAEKRWSCCLLCGCSWLHCTGPDSARAPLSWTGRFHLREHNRLGQTAHISSLWKARPQCLPSGWAHCVVESAPSSSSVYSREHLQGPVSENNWTLIITISKPWDLVHTWHVLSDRSGTDV